MMKANNQLGFININEDSIDKIIKDDEVIFERGFLREKTSTTLPINFGGVGKDLKDYRVYGNTYQNSTSGKNICLQANIIGVNTIRFDVKPNVITQTFTLSLIPPLSVNSMSIIAFADGANLGSVGTINLINQQRSIATITLIESIYNTFQNANEVHFNLYKSGSGFDTTSLIEEPQIENNSSFTSYEEYTGGQSSPNPDYPQEIVSCGDRTKNLLNVSNEYSVTTWQEIDVNLQPGDYIVNCTNTSTNVESGNTSLMNFYHSDNTYDQLYFSRVDKVGTVTITAETTKVRIYSGGSYAVSNGKTTILTNLMIRKSNISDGTYEPYGKYKIPVNVRSENLFDKDNANTFTGYITSTKISGSGQTKTLYIPCKPNTSYTITKILSARFIVGTTGNTPIIDESVIDYLSNNTATKLTITTSANAKYLCVFYYHSSYDTSITEQQILDSIMIVEGSTAPSKYIPYYNETTNIYLDEPLRKIDGYSDYIDFINGKVVRKIKEDILNGNENWTTYGSNLYTVQKIYNNNPFIVGYGLSNLYIYNSIQREINAGTVNGEFALQKSGQNYNLFIKNTDIGSLENLKSSLSIKNMTLQYPLETPTEETITLPNIPTIDGNNTLNIETEITPSQVYIKYKSNN